VPLAEPPVACVGLPAGGVLDDELFEELQATSTAETKRIDKA
jgi:hypothetical protein